MSKLLIRIKTWVSLMIGVLNSMHIFARRYVGIVSGLTTNLLNCTPKRDADFLMNIFKSHVRPIPDYASPFMEFTLCW